MTWIRAPAWKPVQIWCIQLRKGRVWLVETSLTNGSCLLSYLLGLSSSKAAACALSRSSAAARALTSCVFLASSCSSASYSSCPLRPRPPNMFLTNFLNDFLTDEGETSACSYANVVPCFKPQTWLIPRMLGSSLRSIVQYLQSIRSDPLWTAMRVPLIQQKSN